MFDHEDWKKRLGKAQTQEEFAALIMELPERQLHEITEEEREYVLMEEKIDAQFRALIEKRKKDHRAG